MSAARVERRLAAILAAGVAGYSRLIGTDEEGTLARLKAIRAKLIDPAIAAHRGLGTARRRRRQGPADVFWRDLVKQTMISAAQNVTRRPIPSDHRR